MWTRFLGSRQPWPSVRKIPRVTRGLLWATATEIYDYLRLLFARCGQTFCIKCGTEVRRDNPEAIAHKVLSLAPGRRFYVLYELRIAQAQPAGNAPRQEEARAACARDLAERAK